LRYPRTAAPTPDFVLARLGHLTRRSASVLGV